MTERRIKRLSEMPLSKALDMEQDIAGPGKDYENEDFWAWALAAEMLEKRLAELEKQVEELTKERDSLKARHSSLAGSWDMLEIERDELRERAERAEAHLAAAQENDRNNVLKYSIDLSIARKALEAIAEHPATDGGTFARKTARDALKELGAAEQSAAVPDDIPPEAAGQIPQVGDYVLATKYDDGDPCDHFYVGFVSRMTEHPTPRFMIVDEKGNNQRHNGFRRAERITHEEGRRLVELMPSIGDTPGPSVWEHLARIRREIAADTLSAGGDS